MPSTDTRAALLEEVAKAITLPYLLAGVLDRMTGAEVVPLAMAAAQAALEKIERAARSTPTSIDTRAALEMVRNALEEVLDAVADTVPERDSRLVRASQRGWDAYDATREAAEKTPAPEEHADTPDDHAQFAEVRSLGLAAGRERLEARRKHKEPAPEERGVGYSCGLHDHSTYAEADACISPPAPVEGRDEDGYPIERGIPYPVDLSKLPHADAPTPPNAAPVEGKPREVGIARTGREGWKSWECPRCGSRLGAGVEVCDREYDEDGGYTPHSPVYRPDGVAAPVEGERITADIRKALDFLDVQRWMIRKDTRYKVIVHENTGRLKSRYFLLAPAQNHVENWVLWVLGLGAAEYSLDTPTEEECRTEIFVHTLGIALPEGD